MSSQTPQPNLIPEEWLSAYMDDELDADQRQLVETAISQNPQLAQLLYDLQATRRLVQQLPSFPRNASLRHPSSSADRNVLDLDDGLSEQPKQRGTSASSLSDSNDAQITERLREDRGFSDSDSEASVFRIGSWQLSHWRALALAATVVGVAVVGSLTWYGVFGGGSNSVAYAPGAPGATTQSAADNERNLMDSEGGPSSADNMVPMAPRNLATEQYGAAQSKLPEAMPPNFSNTAPAISAPAISAPAISAPAISAPAISAPTVAATSQAPGADLYSNTQPPPSLFEALPAPSAAGGAATTMPNASIAQNSERSNAARGINPPNLAAPDQQLPPGTLSQGFPEAAQAKNDVAGSFGPTGQSMSDKVSGEAQVDAKGIVADSQQLSLLGDRSQPKIASTVENSEPMATIDNDSPASSARGGLGGAQPSGNFAGGFGSPSPPKMQPGGGGGAGIGGGRIVEPGNLLPPPGAYSDPGKADLKFEESNNQTKKSKADSSVENQTDNLSAKRSLKKTTLVTKALIFRSSAWTDDEMLAQLEANALLRQVKSLREKNSQRSASLPQAQVAPVTLAIVSLEFEQRQKLFQLAQQIGLNESIQENEQTTYAIFLSRKELSQLQQALNDAMNSSIKFTMITSSSDQSSEKSVLIINPR